MHTQPDVRVRPKSGRRRLNRNKLMENLFGYIFISPMMIGVLVITVLPILASFLLSFTEWNFIMGVRDITWVGLDNFNKLWHDQIFWKSMKNNIVFVLVVPITLIFSLLLAVSINKYVYFKDFFKVIYFMPYISSIVAVAMVWQVLFHPSYGPINNMLMALGLDDPPKWIADVDFALPSIMIIQIWISIGYNLIIYIAGLQSIPRELYEASDMDGAKPWQKFRYITMPMLSPTTFFLLITGLIGTFKVFDVIQVLTNGGPSNSTSVVVFHLYRTAFDELKMSYASTMALVLFATIFAITLLQWYGQRKWVNY